MSENQRQDTAQEEHPGAAAQSGEQQPGEGATRSEGAEASGEAAESAGQTGGTAAGQAGGAGAEAAAERDEGEEAGGEGAEPASAEALDPELLRQRVDELEQALAEAESKAQEHWDQVLRMRAELENAQRRAEKDVEQAKRQSLEKLVNDLLQVKDSLEMGVRAAEDAEADREKLLEGSQLTLKMLDQVFERFEIEEIDPQGERFNPDFHEAMSTQPTDEQEPNTVLHVIQKGYRLKERLLRPALVVVAKKGDGSAAGGSVDESA